MFRENLIGKLNESERIYSEQDLKEAESQTEKYIEFLKKKPIIEEALNQLEKNLPKNLKYHNLSHTKDVWHESILFAAIDNLPRNEIELLSIAAVYHDIGFIKKSTTNEKIGAEMAAEAMKKYGYSKEEIEAVVEMIEDTELKQTEKGLEQKPRSILAKYLLDADLSNFGRKDFMEKINLVFEEVKPGDKVKFFKTVLGLITNHKWLTGPAKTFRQPQEEENIKMLKGLLERTS